jgi:TRAP-type mannitol/chloroaromatic compound transport system permease large subunit
MITCAMFATATGIVGAVVTLMGLLAFPQMLKAGYDVTLLGRRHLRGRLSRHSDTAEHPAHRLCGDGRHIGGEALCGGAVSRAFCWRAVRPLYRHARGHKSEARAEAAESPQTDVPLITSCSALLTSFFPLAFLILAVLGAILFGWRRRRKRPPSARSAACCWRSAIGS